MKRKKSKMNNLNKHPTWVLENMVLTLSKLTYPIPEERQKLELAKQELARRNEQGLVVH